MVQDVFGDSISKELSSMVRMEMQGFLGVVAFKTMLQLIQEHVSVQKTRRTSEGSVTIFSSDFQETERQFLLQCIT